MGLHQVNCCGTKVALGMSACAVKDFTKAEALCESQYPACGCASNVTMAEDGFSSFTDGDFAAKCVAGTCRSYVKNAAVNCTKQGLVDPKPVKTCSSVADCDVSPLLTDCCGSQTDVGIAKWAKADFDAVQKKCGDSIGVCACPPAPTKLEDGKTLTTSTVPMQCVNGSCMTGTF